MKYARIVIAIFWSAIAGMVIVGAMFYDIPEQNLPNVNTIVGFVLGTIAGTIVNYYFGSSQGSQEKTEMLRRND